MSTITITNQDSWDNLQSNINSDTDITLNLTNATQNESQLSIIIPDTNNSFTILGSSSSVTFPLSFTSNSTRLSSLTFTIQNLNITGYLDIAKDAKNNILSFSGTNKIDATSIINNVTAKSSAGIHIGENTTLTITSSDKNGKLTVTGGTNCAGIGSNSDENGGTITISGSSIIETTGGKRPNNKEFGGGAGIGTGSSSDIENGQFIKGASITIKDSSHVKTIGYNNASGIGGGVSSDGGTISILGSAHVNSKNITVNIDDLGGAGIGGGIGGFLNTATTIINISDSANVESTGGYLSPGIGNSPLSAGATISIFGSATVKSIGGKYAAGIGGCGAGNNDSKPNNRQRNVVFDPFHQGGDGGTISIYGSAKVESFGGDYAPGIGGGTFYHTSTDADNNDTFSGGSGGTISILDSAKVTSTGGINGVGIGGGGSFYDTKPGNFKFQGGDAGTIIIGGNGLITCSGGINDSGINLNDIGNGYGKDGLSTRESTIILANPNITTLNNLPQLLRVTFKYSDESAYIGPLGLLKHSDPTFNLNTFTDKNGVIKLYGISTSSKPVKYRFFSELVNDVFKYDFNYDFELPLNSQTQPIFYLSTNLTRGIFLF